MVYEDPDALTITFDSLSGNGVRVAIIDTGIDSTHLSVGDVCAGTWLKISPDGALVEESDYGDDLGHGTACAAIVRRLAPRCELLAVKIATEEKTITAELLAAGIDWAVQHQADVINISAGTIGIGETKLLAESCRKAAAAGVVVVASESNEGHCTYPAAFDSTLAVGGEAPERERYAYRCDPAQARRFIAYGGYQKTAWIEPRFVFISGVSFAAARITGVIALIIERFGRLPHERLLEILRYNSVNGHAVPGVVFTEDNSSYPPPKSIDWIKRAAIYPYSKEMHSLVRFRHLLPFDLVGVADPVAKGSFGKDAGEVINVSHAGLRVKANLNDALQDADTLILGFTRQLGILHQRDVGNELARTAIELGKNVYSFEPMCRPQQHSLLRESLRRHLRIAWPGIDDVDLEELRQSADLATSYARTPILGVFGTSSAQGKFTLQLLLREGLLAMGLKVGQIGSEHQSKLFGMDDCFPIGYVNNVSLKLTHWKQYFDLRYKQIVRDRNVDIIIVGSQGGLIPPTLANRDSDFHTFMSMLYLCATQSDSYILVVNHVDDPQLIQDTMDTLRIIGKGRTILLALSNRRKRITNSFGRRLVTTEIVDPAEQAEYTSRLEDRFQLPVITMLDPNGTQRMIETVLAAYSGT